MNKFIKLSLWMFTIKIALTHYMFDKINEVTMEVVIFVENIVINNVVWHILMK